VHKSIETKAFSNDNLVQNKNRKQVRKIKLICGYFKGRNAGVDGACPLKG
jgi:hypothetical protein